MNLWQQHIQFKELQLEFQKDSKENPYQLYHLVGPEDYGKMSLIQEFEKSTLINKHNSQISILVPKENELSYASIWNHAKASSEELTQELTALQEELSQVDEANKSALITETVKRWKENDETIRISVFIPSYSGYSPRNKEFVLSNILTPLEDSGVKARFLVSGHDSIFRTLDLEEYWFPLEKKFKEIELHPFDHQQLLKIVEKENLDRERFELFWEETQGVPAKVIKEFTNIPIEKSEDIEKIEVNDLLTSLSEKEFTWVVLAAYLGKVDRDSFNIIENPYNAFDGIHYIKSQGLIPIKVNQGKTWFDEVYAESIRAWNAKTKPHYHEKLLQVTEIVQAAHALFPDENERILLSLLSALNAFSIDIIDSVLTGQAKQIKLLLRTHPEFFDQQNHLYKVKSKYRNVLMKYPEVKEIPEVENLQNKVREIWEKELVRLESLIEEYRLKLEDEKLEEKKNTEEVQRLLGEIKSAEKVHIKNFKAEWQRKQFRTEITTVKRSFAFPLLLMLIGAGSIYFGMIYFKELSWPYLLAGGLFMSIGLWQSSESKEKIRKVAIPLDENQLHRSIEEDEFLALLHLKKDALFHQKRFIHTRIERYEKELSGKKSLLEMPYI